MILSTEQQSAMSKILHWLEGGANWLFYLAGFAGTGKTTLIQELINSLDKAPHCLAPTGKAASVLQRKLKNAEVSTIHRALYKPVMPDISKLEALRARLQEQRSAGIINATVMEEVEEEKKRLAAEKLRFTDNLMKGILAGDFVIVDEASMVTKKMVEDLQKTGAKVLFVGDSGQLPPVEATAYFQSREPDALLSTIHRQALDNPIIRLSMQVREGQKVEQYIENEHIVRRPKEGYRFEELAKADQVLCGLNSMRRRINRAIRKLNCIPAEQIHPIAGEKLICLKNKFVRGGWIVNGFQCFAASSMEQTDVGDFAMDVLYDGDVLNRLICYDYPFLVHYRPQTVEEPWAARSQLCEFDFGYAVTVHKSQGSEWNTVALVDDGLNAADKKFRRRWLYTAVTRAKERLIWLT